jgi:hypothetical protein
LTFRDRPPDWKRFFFCPCGCVLPPLLLLDTSKKEGGDALTTYDRRRRYNSARHTERRCETALPQAPKVNSLLID